MTGKSTWPTRFLAWLGSWGSKDGEFRSHAAIAVDRPGNVYVADSGIYCVQVFAPAQ